MEAFKSFFFPQSGSINQGGAVTPVHQGDKGDKEKKGTSPPGSETLSTASTTPVWLSRPIVLPAAPSGTSVVQTTEPVFPSALDSSSSSSVSATLSSSATELVSSATLGVADRPLKEKILTAARIQTQNICSDDDAMRVTLSALKEASLGRKDNVYIGNISTVGIFFETTDRRGIVSLDVQVHYQPGENVKIVIGEWPYDGRPIDCGTKSIQKVIEELFPQEKIPTASGDTASEGTPRVSKVDLSKVDLNS